MKFQILDMCGNVIKVFHGMNAKNDAREYIHKNQSLRLWVRDVTPKG